MLHFLVLLLFGGLGQLLAQQRPCTPEDLCHPVGKVVCDNSYCVPFSFDELNEFGDVGIKIYTWNLAQTPFHGYCPLKSKFEVSEPVNGKVNITQAIIIHSGQRCNVTTTAYRYFTGEPDPLTGLYDYITTHEAGYKYEVCFPYLERGVAFIFRFCQAFPSYPDGKSCASIYVEEVASGNCRREKLLQFLKDWEVDFPQINANCLQPTKC